MRRFRILMIAGLAAGAVCIGIGCGGADGDEPTLSGIAVECEDSGDGDVGEIVEAVSVRVDDPDRDLVSVDGRVNGIQVTLTDDDADGRFAWRPPESSEPLTCTGDFVVLVTATDKAGNTSTKTDVISK
ncbi:MAG: hypothetical protein ACQEVA_15275 [Myxococcota bacterium]